MNSSDEISLIAKVKSLGVKFDPWEGLTTPEQRRDSVRTAIAPISHVVFTVRDGKQITLAQQFERVYGCAL